MRQSKLSFIKVGGGDFESNDQQVTTEAPLSKIPPPMAAHRSYTGRVKCRGAISSGHGCACRGHKKKKKAVSRCVKLRFLFMMRMELVMFYLFTAREGLFILFNFIKMAEMFVFPACVWCVCLCSLALSPWLSWPQTTKSNYWWRVCVCVFCVDLSAL